MKPFSLLFIPLAFLSITETGYGGPDPKSPLRVDLRDGDRILRILGREDGDRLGFEVKIADVVGSGPLDLIVSSDGAEDFFDDGRSGRVDVFDGATLPATGIIDLRDPEPLPAVTLFGERDEQGRFGFRVEMGDFDGDDIPDLAISAPEFDAGGEDFSGRVYLFFGGPADATDTYRTQSVLMAGEADVRIDGDDSRDRAGRTLAVGDFDSDGFDDLVIGAPDAEDEIPDEAGRVYAIPGRADWSGSSSISLRDARFASAATRENAIRVFRGARKFDRIGESLGTGDLNGDGVTDLLIGVDHEDVRVDGKGTFTFLEVGRIHLLSGPNVFPATPLASESILDATASDAILVGKSEFDLFGDNFLSNDWNDDGIDDLWVSAPFSEIDPVGNDVDDFGIVSLAAGFPTLLPPVELTGPRLFAFSSEWMRVHHGVHDLVDRLAKESDTPIVSREIRYPVGTALAIVGPEDGERRETLFGGSMAVGDLLDSDGIDELAIGASKFDSLGGSEEDGGYVAVVSREDLLSATPGTPLELAVTDPSVEIEGVELGDRFGFRMAVGNLLPASGEELAIGAPFADAEIRDGGVVYVLNVKTAGVPTETPPPKAPARKTRFSSERSTPSPPLD